MDRNERSEKMYIVVGHMRKRLLAVAAVGVHKGDEGVGSFFGGNRHQERALIHNH